MVGKISRPQSVKPVALKKKTTSNTNSAESSHERKLSTAQTAEAKTQPSREALRKQFIMKQLIKQFGEQIVHEPKFQDMYKFFEKKLESSPQLQEYIDSNL